MATHGTHEFFRERAQITKRLIREKGFAAVAVEADWFDAYRVNRYVRRRAEHEDIQAVDALEGFKRFPSWKWPTRISSISSAGSEATTTRSGLARPRWASTGSICTASTPRWRLLSPTWIRWTRKQPRKHDNDTDALTFTATMPSLTPSRPGFTLGDPARNEVITRLVDLRGAAGEFAIKQGRLADDDSFYAVENERLIRDAEYYYRTMCRGDVSSWNLRDQHMAETLDSLASFLTGEGPTAKIVVWAHNHIWVTPAPP